MGTFGRMWFEDSPERWWFTVERPWHENAVGVSCIPPGDYKLRHGTYTRNGTIAPYPDLEFVDVPGRANIEIHAANWAHELKGCIAPGKGMSISSWMISDSHKALNEILAVVSGEPDIEIKVLGA